MNNIIIRNIEPQEITINGTGTVSGITNVYVNGVDVTEGTKAYVIVPTKLSELTNDEGFITNAEETDPTVPSYVKAISLADINSWNDKQDALVSGTTIKTINSTSLLGSGNIDVGTEYTAGDGIDITDDIISNTITSYNDLSDLPTIPTNLSELTNDVGYVTRTVDDLEHYLPISVLEDILPSVSDSGTELYLENSAKYKLKMEIEPHEVEQYTTTGKNLLDSSTIQQTTKNGITCTYDSTTQEIKFNGTCNTDNTNFEFEGTSFDATSGLSTGSAHYVSGSVTNYCNLRFLKSDYGGNMVLDITPLSDNNKVLSITSNETRTFTINRIRFNNGSVANNFTIKVMFADSTNTDYEPYTGGIPAPNPEYPQTIHTNNGDNTITIENRNLINMDNLQIGKAWNNASTLDRAVIYVPCLPSTKYTISFNDISNFDAMYRFEKAATEDNTATSGVTQVTATTTITTNAASHFIGLQFNKTSISTSDFDDSNIQIERGSTATSYVEHEEIQYPLSLGEYDPFVGTDVELVSIDTQWGKYQNFLYKNTPDNPFYDSGWAENYILLGRRVYKYIFDPADEWELLSSDHGYTFGATLNRTLDTIHQYPSFGSTKHYAVCTHFRDRSLATDQTNEAWIETMAKYIYIHFPPNSTITTLEDLIDWITNNQITAYIIQGGFSDSYAEDLPTWSHYPTVDSEYQNLINNTTAYDGGTNITQVNDDLPLELKASTFKKVS